jgi:hypothetical protein
LLLGFRITGGCADDLSVDPQEKKGDRPPDAYSACTQGDGKVCTEPQNAQVIGL